MHFWNSNNPLKLVIDNYDIPSVSDTKFLGIYIDKQLTWNTQVQYTLDKLRNNKRLMSLSKHVLDKHCLRNIYFAHIHSHLNYWLLVWGSMITSTQHKELRKVQEECINLISKGSTGETANTIGILSLEKMIQFNLCQLGYKLSHSMLPVPLHKIFDASGGKKSHRYPTRNKSTPNIQKHHCSSFNKSFLCQSIKTYSQLSESLKREPNLTRFVKGMKKHLLSSEWTPSVFSGTTTYPISDLMKHHSTNHPFFHWHNMRENNLLAPHQDCINAYWHHIKAASMLTGTTHNTVAYWHHISSELM